MNRTAALALVGAIIAAPRPTRAQISAVPYKIGLAIPLTGLFADQSAESLRGAEIAAAEINNAGGINGHPLQLVAEDTQATPAGGVAAMRKLVQVDGVRCVLTLYTNVVVAQIPLADELKVPVLAQMEVPGIMNRGAYTFAHAPTILGVADILRRQFVARRYKRVFALLIDSAYGASASPVVRAAAQAAGAQYDEASYEVGAGVDFRGIVIRARDFRPDALFIAELGSPAEGTLVKNVREIGMTAPIYLSSNFYLQRSWRAAVGSYAEDLYFCGVTVRDDPASRAFATAWRAKMGYAPSYQPAEAYDDIRLFAYGIARGGYSGEAIRDAIASVRGLPSALGGTITMGPDHYSILTSTALWHPKNGKLERVVVPKA